MFNEWYLIGINNRLKSIEIIEVSNGQKKGKHERMAFSDFMV